MHHNPTQAVPSTISDRIILQNYIPKRSHRFDTLHSLHSPDSLIFFRENGKNRTRIFSLTTEGEEMGKMGTGTRIISGGNGDRHADHFEREKKATHFFRHHY